MLIHEQTLAVYVSAHAKDKNYHVHSREQQIDFSVWKYTL